MDWKEAEKAIQEIVSEIMNARVVQNTAIRDNIFSVLEENCTVIYYPLENEKNRGFHIKRIVKNKLEDFVYINTAKPVAEQVFTAAHEFGHIYEVAAKVWKKMGCSDNLTEKEEEDLTNRFAAELLMPVQAFKKVFSAYMSEMDLENGKVKLYDLVSVIVMQMNTFLVPYEAVKRRLLETGLVMQNMADFLESKENEILQLVDILTKYQNSYLEKDTGSKTISGIRGLLVAADKQENIDDYLIKRIKRDLEIVDIPEAEEVEIRIGEENDE